jgi:hypothetical protein
VVKLISVHRMDSAFLGSLLTACSLFRLQLPFECIDFFEKEIEMPKTSFWVQLWLQSEP